MRKPWHLMPCVSKAMPTIHTRAVFFLIASCSGPVLIKTLELSRQLCCSPKSVKVALDFLTEKGFVLSEGTPHSRFFTLAPACPDYLKEVCDAARKTTNVGPRMIER